MNGLLCPHKCPPLSHYSEWFLLTHIFLTQSPLKLRLSHREQSCSLSPCGRTASSFDSLHTSLLSSPPEHDIYGNLFHCFVLATAPSRPVWFQQTSVSAAMNMKTYPQPKGEKNLTLSLSSSRKESAQPQPTHCRLDTNPLTTSVFLRMLSSTNQRGRKWADKLCNRSKSQQEWFWKHTKALYNDTLLSKLSTIDFLEIIV